MDTRRQFLKKASLLSAGSGLLNVLPPAIARAMAIDPLPGSTYLDAEHVVFLMQENRSFDHTYGTLQGVRGYNDPRAIQLPNKNLVWLQTNAENETYAPFRFDIKDTKITWMSSLPHAWSNQVDARNYGHYDRWLDVKRSGHDEYASMPLTMGYYTREDIPFYYSLADAFTICDQHFCSALTGTTPNRLYFWTGTIRERPDENAQANVWNEDADYATMVEWKTFPERLEENGISWKVYQNELSVGVGFEGEEDPWLANFGDNPLEYFKQFHVKLHPEHIKNLPKTIRVLKTEIENREKQLPAISDIAVSAQVKDEIDWLKKQLAINQEDQQNYTLDKYAQLSAHEKAIHQKAFDTNRNDPQYHSLVSHKYHDGEQEREVKIPAGDVLHQFRQDVNNNQLPTVSWIVAPENFSDHPSSAWYGAWYISEVLDILTKNPEVWKKTIFVLTYDENDGYFDHVPPFVPPHPTKKESGAASKGINASLDYVTNDAQQSRKKEARESPVGLGYRVPLVIASPWSRGGWVNSQVFDLTSSLQFLEKFLSHKSGKKIREPNITEWRRTVCGDLTSIFRPYNGEKISNPEFLQKNAFIESIHKAKFRNAPSNYKKLTKEEIEQINKARHSSPLMPMQENGTRIASALPYELYADGRWSADRKSFLISMKAGNKFFGPASAGSPFHIYAACRYKNEEMCNRPYAVAAGDTLTDSWFINDFENAEYHLRLYGPNGFYREFSGNNHDPLIDVIAVYHQSGNRPTGKLVFQFINKGKKRQSILVIDNSYKTPERTQLVGVPGSKNLITLDTAHSYGWYDFSIKIKGNNVFGKRYAGRIETGLPTKTDPLMGRVI
jgi:phospholipase C